MRRLSWLRSTPIQPMRDGPIVLAEKRHPRFKKAAARFAAEGRQRASGGAIGGSSHRRPRPCDAGVFPWRLGCTRGATADRLARQAA
jgi:hypothetical protein